MQLVEAHYRRGMIQAEYKLLMRLAPDKNQWAVERTESGKRFTKGRKKMTVYGVIVSAVVRKIKALVAEYRKLVAEATAVEQKLIGKAKSDAEAGIVAAEQEEKRLIAEAKAVIEEDEATEASIVRSVKAETEKLRNELIDKIAKL
jgi:hypothetical protein